MRVARSAAAIALASLLGVAARADALCIPPQLERVLVTPSTAVLTPRSTPLIGVRAGFSPGALDHDDALAAACSRGARDRAP